MQSDRIKCQGVLGDDGSGEGYSYVGAGCRAGYVSNMLIQKSRRNLKTLVATIVADLGFARSGSTFIRHKDKFIQIIHLQLSSYNNQLNYIRSYLYYAPDGISGEYSFRKDEFDISLSVMNNFEDGREDALITNGDDVPADCWRCDLKVGLKIISDNLDELSSVEEILADAERSDDLRRVTIFQRFRDKLEKFKMDADG